MFRLSLLRLSITAGVLTSLIPAAYGQKWEVGAGGGASFYNSKTITGGPTDVAAKFKPGYGFTGYFGQIGNKVGGEVRYTFLSNDMELSNGGNSFTMGGRSQSIQYNFIYYFSDKESKLRPYVSGGGGMKQYTGKGTNSAFQPFMASAVLTNTSEWKPLVSAGGGVRYSMSPKMQLRAEVLAYMTQAPTQVITPVLGSISGWYFDIVPMVTLSYVW